jgi:hypothetical protein
MRLPPDDFKQSSNVCEVWQRFIFQEIEANEQMRKKRKLLSNVHMRASELATCDVLCSQ